MIWDVVMLKWRPWNVFNTKSYMKLYRSIIIDGKIHIITANLLGFSLCLRVFSSPFKVHTKYVNFEFGRKFRLVETVATWPVTCFGWKPLLLIRSHFTSGLLALTWYVNKVPQSLAHCDAPYVVPGITWLLSHGSCFLSFAFRFNIVWGMSPPSKCTLAKIYTESTIQLRKLFQWK